MKLKKIGIRSAELFTAGTDSEKHPHDSYSVFSYPKILKFLKFETERYRIKGFGNMMTMYTDTLFGMQLLTMAFMPSEGNSVPFLIIDIMTVKDKRLIFVEYYDCTSRKTEQPLLKDVYEKYCGLTDHKEEPAWYVSERTDYSLIKLLDKDDNVTIAEIVAASIKAYKKAAFSAEKDTENIAGLLKFRDRMINEGNPSTAVMKRVFGKKGAEDFFVKCVMPD